MRITKTEEVTRTYCDVCGIEITNKTKVGAGIDKPNEHWVTCDSTKHSLRDTVVSLKCSDIAKLLTDYPDIQDFRKNVTRTEYLAGMHRNT